MTVVPNDPTWSNADILAAIFALVLRPKCNSEVQTMKTAHEIAQLLPKAERRQMLTTMYENAKAAGILPDLK